MTKLLNLVLWKSAVNDGILTVFTQIVEKIMRILKNKWFKLLGKFTSQVNDNIYLKKIIIVKPILTFFTSL